MAYEETFWIDIINKQAVTNLKEPGQVLEWKQFFGSIVPIRIYAIKPIENTNKQPFFSVESIEPLNVRLTLGIVPNVNQSLEFYQRETLITVSDWEDDTSTNSWAGKLDLDDDDLRNIVSFQSPIEMVLQFDFFVDGAWATACLLPAKIYNTATQFN